MEKKSFKQYIEVKKEVYGERFDPSQLTPKFIKYYENHKRIEVEFSYGKVRGFVGVTTGWRPCFLLMRTNRSRGSSYTLKSEDNIVKELNY